MIALTTQLTAWTSDWLCWPHSGSPQVPPTAQYTWNAV